MGVEEEAKVRAVRFSRHDLFAIALVIALGCGVYGRIVNQWFLWDDPQLLFGVVNHAPWDFFVDPVTWRTQSSTNFVPLLLGEFELDYALFGFNSRYHYIHHLLIFLAAVVAFYCYLRRVTSIAVATAAASTFLLSAPALSVGALLSNRHYAEGLLLSVGALLVVEKRSAWRSLAAAVLFFLACLEKEVFVPLPALIVMKAFVDRSRFSVIVRDTMPFVAVLAIYIPWRLVMLGKLGGYGAARTLSQIGALPAEAFRGSVGQSAFAAVFLVIGLALLFVASLRKLRPIGLMAIGCFFFLSPPLLALTVIDERYVFVATATMVAASAASVGHDRSLLAGAGFVVVCLTLASSGLVYRTRHNASLDLMKREGSYLWNAPPTAKPLLASSNGWYVEGIRWMRRAVKNEQPVRALGSVQALVMENLEPTAVETIDVSARKLGNDFTRTVRGFDGTLPLDVHFSRNGDVLSWKVGGATGSVFYFLPEPQLELIPIGPKSWIRLPSRLRAPTFDADPQAAYFRVIVSVHGRWRHSPSLRFPRSGEVAAWRSSGVPR